MAMAIFRDLLRDRADAPDWRIESAGVWAIDGQAAASFSRAVMQQRGLDLGGHRSKTVTCELLGSFDLILTMERGQKEALIAEFPMMDGKVHLLSEAAGSYGDIEDPYGRGLADFEATAHELATLLSLGKENILRLAGLTVS